jgi:Cu-processing system permease protein
VDISTIATVAGQELRIGIRSRWTATFAALFAALALAISYFGLVTAGVAGFQGFTRTAASLLNLVLYIVPLAGLATGSLAITADPGALELLFSQPVSRAEVLLGKAAGLAASLAAATVLGFGVAGVVIAFQTGDEAAGPFLAVVALAVALACIFAGLGLLAGAMTGSRTRAFAAALCLWFFFVIFYDLLALGATLVLREHTANLFLFLSLFGNPVDLVRVAALIACSGQHIFGAAGAALVKFLGGPGPALAALLTALALWIAAPLSLAAAILRRRDL